MNEPTQPAFLRCYELAPPGAVAAHSDAVARAVRQAFGVPADERYPVSVSKYAGWIYYEDSARLWHGSGAVMSNRAAVAERAESVLRKLRSSLASGDRRLPEPLRRLAIIPDRVRPMEIVALPRDGVFDHWLYRAEPQLVLGPDRPDASVIGAAVELRIGEAGAIVGFTCRWRALTGRTTSVPQQPPVPRAVSHHAPDAPEQPQQPDAGHHDHDHPHDGGHGHGGGELVYVLDGEGIPQLLLAPFYRTAGGHVVSFASASRMSLTVDLWGTDADEGMRLYALPAGGSGDYEFEWGWAPIDDPWDMERVRGRRVRYGGDEHPATAGEITVPIGAYLVVVQVRDRVTGAFQHHQQHVFCSPLRRNGEPAAEPPQLPSPGVA